MLDPMPPDVSYGDDPSDWSTLLYSLGRGLTKPEVAHLRAVLTRRFGERTDVTHDPDRMRLRLRCGAIKNRAHMAQFKQFGDLAAGRLEAGAARIYPST